MRELKSIKVKSIALVPKAKSNLPIYFPASDMIEMKNLVLNSADGNLTVLVFGLGAKFMEGGRSAPGHLEEMAHEFLRSGAELEIYNTRKPVDRRDAAVIESFIVQPGDQRFENIRDHENKPVDAAGAWAVVIRLFDEGLRDLYLGTNAWSAVSIFGEAVFDKKPRLSSLAMAPLKVAVL